MYLCLEENNHGWRASKQNVDTVLLFFSDFDSFFSAVVPLIATEEILIGQ